MSGNENTNRGVTALAAVFPVETESVQLVCASQFTKAIEDGNRIACNTAETSYRLVLGFKESYTFPQESQE